ncbi:ribonuclease D [Candidatus Odyssella acanthamoebae]|uniref:3'-5' exonuclease n=1 Tax=Candidatus Odyssella acanthamoebae TaxID=91604 RepID=A0A077AVA6_9PROT|nr:ribonuclease D [Candidatus Paracaedibacter acanthamoebae]AIK95964.1 3'-5' exonuclease [Candidatus Paracaedibacter acanthamoebae]
MKIQFHKNDLPADLDLGKIVAIDTETMGLKPARDRLCLVQLSAGDGVCHLVQIDSTGEVYPENMIALLNDDSVQKLFHYARFDVAVLLHTFGVSLANIYCTKIASKLVRTYTDKHGLKELCKELLSVEISKQEQSSYWGADELTEEQKKYAATDVLYLHKLKDILDERLEKEGRTELAQECFSFILTRAYLDLLAGEEFDIFSH